MPSVECLCLEYGVHTLTAAVLQICASSKLALLLFCEAFQIVHYVQE
jgi:hypothetical protein